MRIEAHEFLEDANGLEWTVKVDSDGDVKIVAPCGKESDFFKAGKKGRFFTQIAKVYKKLAEATQVWDTDKEEMEPCECENPCPECEKCIDCDLCECE